MQQEKRKDISMSCKLSFIPEIKDYDYIRQEMNKDLEYRLENRTDKTMYGRPLYKNINVKYFLKFNGFIARKKDFKNRIFKILDILFLEC